MIILWENSPISSKWAEANIILRSKSGTKLQTYEEHLSSFLFEYPLLSHAITVINFFLNSLLNQKQLSRVPAVT